MDSPDLPTPVQMSTDCVCLNTQRAARAVARRYDAALRPAGLTSGQFSILAALNQDAAVSIGVLADGLGLERTTLTRNVAPLEKAGLVRSGAAAGDKRVRGLSLTALGREKLALAVPLWSAAQRDHARLLNPYRWATIQPALATLTRD